MFKSLCDDQRYRNLCRIQAIAELVRRYADKTESYGDVFLGILAHELRNPLNTIKLSGRILNDGPVAEVQARSVARILRAAASIERLTNDLSILVRSRMGVPVSLSRTDVDLGEICDRALEEIRQAHDNVLLDQEKVGDLKGKWDPERLDQVIFNLVVNGISSRTVSKHVEHILARLGVETRTAAAAAALETATKKGICQIELR